MVISQLIIITILSIPPFWACACTCPIYKMLFVVLCDGVCISILGAARVVSIFERLEFSQLYDITRDLADCHFIDNQ